MVYYLPEPLTTPTDWPAFWAQAETMLENARMDLEGLRFQTFEEAVAGSPSQFDMAAYPFRRSDDRDNLAYFHGLGLNALEEVGRLVLARIWSPELAHHWSILMFCHGFLMPGVFASGDDLGNYRKGEASRQKNSRDPQIRWFSHYCLRAYEIHGHRSLAEDAVELLVQSILTGRERRIGAFDQSWFRWLVSEDMTLTNRYRDKFLSLKKMQTLAQSPTDDLPPLDLPIPHPRGVREN